MKISRLTFKKILLFINFYTSTLYLIAQKELTLEKIFASAEFYPYSVENVWNMNNGEHYCLLENASINEYTYKTGKKIRTILNSKDLLIGQNKIPPQIDDFVFSNDEKKILISTETEPLYRRSNFSKYIVWDAVNKQSTEIFNGNKIRLAEFAPDGNKVAFVFNNNLYYQDLINGEIVQITYDGELNKIINGATDWVYEEEFEFSKAFYWSLDGSYIAYYKFDETNVKEFIIEKYNNLYPELYKYKYPKAGESNSEVNIYVYDLYNKKNIKINIDNENEKDIYIPLIKWTQNPKKLAILKMNRLQNQQELIIADVTNGINTVVYSEQNKCYIDLTNFVLYFTKDGKYFVISNETDGYNHLYLYNIDGKLKWQITKGNWEFITLLGFDDLNNKIYFISNYTSPLNHDICSITIEGKDFKVLSEQLGDNSAIFSKNFKYYIHQWSDANNPPITTIKTIKGKVISTLEDNKTLWQNINDYNFQKKEFFTFKTEDEVILNGWMIKPPYFDETKKYPVIFDIYGGPGHQSVLNKWDYMNAWHQFMAKNGFIIVCVDNRGTGGRGEEFKKVTYLQLGKYETIDQIAAAKYLANFNYIDKSRIGIWGWSFGGYLTLLCMTKGADYFSTGIAVAPVTNWRYYDNIYTERFMRTPAENPQGYDDNSPISYVKKLKGKLLIIHGSADDNVHLQNTMELVKQLVNSNKQFEMQIYANKNHGIYGGYTRLHLFTRITNFFMNNL
ncbi:MAG TPA: DPP IV N-terminal domain-containing protein [Bacteroidales bacterium]|nr:DPP IV N-terminal domain-containing protein [Bacteroidales bacterium]